MFQTIDITVQHYLSSQFPLDLFASTTSFTRLTIPLRDKEGAPLPSTNSMHGCLCFSAALAVFGGENKNKVDVIPTTCIWNRTKRG